MKRTTKLALSAVFIAALVTPALAQDNFPDVPANHWAFEALARLKKDGILVGYPDGLFRGGRPASRYEMAAAVHDAYVKLKSVSDGMSSQIKDMNDKIGNGAVTKADLDNLKATLAATQSQVDGMKGWGDDVASLKKLFGEFQKELDAMGVDVAAIKKGLGELDGRVTALEKRKLPVDISGGMDLLMMGGYSTSGQFGITVDGRPTGFGRGSYFDEPVGITRDLTMMHEGELTLTGTNEKGPKWHGTLVIGNMLSGNASPPDAVPNIPPSGEPFPGQSLLGTSVPFNEGPEDMYIQDASIRWDTSISNLNFGVEAGRIGMKISPLIFQRPDVTPYFVNDRWDNGKYYFDGANLSMKFSSAKVNIFGGRDNTSEGGTVGANAIAPLFAGAVGIFYPPIGLTQGHGFFGTGLPISQHMGVTLGTPLAMNGNLNLAYLWLNSNTNVGVSNGTLSGQANGVNVYGGDVTFRVAGFNLDGSYAKSDVVENGHGVVTRQNDAYWINAARDFGRFGAKVGYRQINAQFGAPGDWGRVGVWWNPTDIKGFTADAHFDVNDTTRLTASGQFYSALGNSVNGLTDPLSTSDKWQSLVIGLSHRLGAANTVELGVEDVTLSGFPLNNGGGNPSERWYNIGFSHKISDKSMFRMLWQISDFDGKGQFATDPFSNNPGTFTTHKGGLLTTQLTVKF